LSPPLDPSGTALKYNEQPADKRGTRTQRGDVNRPRRQKNCRECQRRQHKVDGKHCRNDVKNSEAAIGDALIKIIS
jgi:hypothetical protein